MASQVLYPAIVESSMPAFVVQPSPTGGVCRVYFSLSKYNVYTDFSSVHVSLKKQSTGENVVNVTDDTTLGLYRATGIILDVTPHEVLNEDNLYYIDIDSSNLKTVDGSYSGWIPGTLYQLQIRLSSVNYGGSTLGQAAWLNQNANNFSEWSTICILKAISEPYITASCLKSGGSNFDSRNIYGTYTISTPELNMVYNRTTPDKEDLHSYKIQLYSSLNVLLEDSGVLYTNNYVNSNELKYTLKYNLQDNVNYKLKIEFETINNYTETIDIDILVDFDIVAKTTLGIFTYENDPQHFLTGTSAALEGDEGRVIILLRGTETASGATGKYIIRRSSSKDNFSTWEDIKILYFVGGTVNKCISDFTIESGVFYKYGVQLIDGMDRRGQLKVTPEPIIREFDYTFLLGEDNKQLKLKFDNNMNSFNITIGEGVQGTFGQFPVISRQGAMKYKTFPVAGLISFNMDDNNLFLTKEEVYKYQDIIDLYEARESTASYQQYNYTYERDFRAKVMEFLQSHKPLLYKSATEGNILIKLTNVSYAPNQSLSRLVFSFSATATEFADFNMDNLKKYKILKLDGGDNTTTGEDTAHAPHAPIS